MINQNLLLLNGKILVLERVGFLLRLSKATGLSREGAMVTLIVIGCIGIKS